MSDPGREALRPRREPVELGVAWALPRALLERVLRPLAEAGVPVAELRPRRGWVGVLEGDAEGMARWQNVGEHEIRLSKTR
jgi:hypothetical protein